MSKLIKILWTVISYAPLMLVCGIALFIDSLTTKQVTGKIWIGCLVFGIGLLCVLACCWLLVLFSVIYQNTLIFLGKIAIIKYQNVTKGGRQWLLHTV